MNISPAVAQREQAVQTEFLKSRILYLAQSLDMAIAERDQAISDRDALKEELARGEANGDAQ